MLHVAHMLSWQMRPLSKVEVHTARVTFKPVQVCGESLHTLKVLILLKHCILRDLDLLWRIYIADPARELRGDEFRVFLTDALFGAGKHVNK